MHTSERERTSATWGDTRVHLVLGPGDDSPPGGLARFISWVRLLAHAARLAIEQRFDIVQVRNNVPAGLVGWAIQRLRGGRFIYQFTFPLPEAALLAMRRGPFDLPRRAAAVAKTEILLRDWLLQRCDLVLPISEELHTKLRDAGVPSPRLFTFPMCTDSPPDPDPHLLERLRVELGLGLSPVVIYVGTISPRRRLDFLIRAAQRVHQQYPSTTWLFVGQAHGGADKQLMKAAAAAGIAERVIFHGWVPRAQVPAYIALANISVAPIPPLPIYRMSSPTKAVESLAMGCPVVGTNIPDQARLLKASGGGIVVPFEEDAFADAICSLLADPGVAVEMGRMGRAYVRRERSYEVFAARLDAVYRQLCRPETAQPVASTRA
jgi:glycosyltransferase involved in cell wall biosynthesis